MRKAFLIFSIISIQSLAWANSVWSIEKLLTTTSYQDGANCYNAALAGSGLIDYIGYTDSTEYRFFLETLCTPLNNKTDGALIAISQEGWLQHGAISKDQNEIFEKDSFVGKAGQFLALTSSVDNDVQDYKYLVRPESKSPYMQKCTLIAACAIEYFSCPKEPNKTISDCYQSEEFSEIRTLRAKLQTFTLTPTNNAAFLAKNDGEILSLLRAINSKSQNINPKGFCPVHFLVSAYSIVGNMFFSADYSKDEPNTLHYETSELRKNLDILREKIKSANPGDKKIGRILEEQFQNTAI